MTIEITWQLVTILFGVFIYAPMAIFVGGMCLFRYDSRLLCLLIGIFWPLAMIWEWIND